MTPGPKKKGFYQKSVEERSHDHRKDRKVFQDQENTQKQYGKPNNQKNVPEKVEPSNSQPDEPENADEEAKLESNWGRYEEPEQDPHADVSRGEDFEVLLSYSSGAGSQMQLQEEREWNDYKNEVENLALDMNRINSMLKCIPFHKRLDIPSSVFSREQIENFEGCAKNNLKLLECGETITESSFGDEEEWLVLPEQKSSDAQKGEYVVDEDSEESSKNEEDSHMTLIHKKTENLIDSLSSCLSAKAVVQESVVKSPGEKVDGDDLSYLLSLTSSTSKTSDEPKSDTKKLTKSNVDEWLSSILDD